MVGSGVPRPLAGIFGQHTPTYYPPLRKKSHLGQRSGSVCCRIFQCTQEYSRFLNPDMGTSYSNTLCTINIRYHPDSYTNWQWDCRGALSWSDSYPSGDYANSLTYWTNHFLLEEDSRLSRIYTCRTQPQTQIRKSPVDTGSSSRWQCELHRCACPVISPGCSYWKGRWPIGSRCSLLLLEYTSLAQR